MSAYVCDRDHIAYLVDAAQSMHIGGASHAWRGGLRWVFDINRETGAYKVRELPSSDMRRASEVGDMLWKENVASVSARYPEDPLNNLPGPILKPGQIFAYGDHKPSPYRGGFNPVQVLKAIDCYEYQSCEHGGWLTSEAHAFCEALRKRAISMLPGYDDAAWGAPQPRNAA